MGRLVSQVEWERRREVVGRLAASELSMAEFARREGITYAQLLAWRNRLSRGDSPGGDARASFAEVLVEPEGARVSAPCSAELVLPSGVVLRLYGGADAGLVRLLLAALAPC